MNHLQTKVKLTQPLKIATIKMEMMSQEIPAISEPTGINFRKIISSIQKELKMTKSLNKKQQLL